jgi:hypothetical protein
LLLVKEGKTIIIQILIYFSNAYFIQILILFIIQILIYLLFKYRGGFDGYMCGEFMRWKRWQILPYFSQTFQNHSLMWYFDISRAGFPTFSSFIEYTILLPSPIKKKLILHIQKLRGKWALVQSLYKETTPAPIYPWDCLTLSLPVKIYTIIQT